MGRGKNIKLSRRNVYSVPEDISIQILVRLPVKSLLRFRSICKSWYSLIRSPTFIDAHLKHHTNHTNLLLLLMYESKSGNNFRYSIRYDDDDDESCREYFEAKLPLHLQNLWIYGSCNGLVCLSNRILIASSNIFIWNPALRKLKTLPKPKKIDLPLYAYDMHMAFGFQSQVNDYKVVRIVFFKEGMGMGMGMDNPSYKTSSFLLVEVYSLSTDSWRRIDVLEPSCSIRGCRPVFVNGAAYWTTTDRKVVLRFEMGSEILEEVMLPPNSAFPCIFGLGELLYVFNFDYIRKRYDIWTMESSKMGCWTKRFTVRFDHLTDSVLGFRKNGQLLKIYRDKLLSFDLEIQKSNDLGINTSTYGSSAHSYVESLVLVHGRGDSFSTW